MPVVDVVNWMARRSVKWSWRTRIFIGAKVNQHLLHEASRGTCGDCAGAPQGQGEERSERPGRKLWKQKGTGRAPCRARFARLSGVMAARSTTKAARLQLRAAEEDAAGALRSALSAKLASRAHGCRCVGSGRRTRPNRCWRCGQAESHESALLVAHGENANLERASRKRPSITLAAPNVLQPYDVLKHDLLLLSRMRCSA